MVGYAPRRMLGRWSSIAKVLEKEGSVEKGSFDSSKEDIPFVSLVAKAAEENDPTRHER